MYSKGMSQRDITSTIEDIYGFEISSETISSITDRVVDVAKEWQNRPLKKFYSFVFVDCLYVTIKKEHEAKNCAVRKVMYTTNAIEAINSSFRKVTKKGAFPNEDAVMKLLYLRTEELYKKWNDRPIANWAMVKNQLIMDDKIQARILKYEQFE